MQGNRGCPYKLQCIIPLYTTLPDQSCFSLVLGTPRASSDVFEETSKYGKQIKRESPPIRSFEGGITKGKPYEGVNTIKEMGRSIHEIPRKESQDSRKTPVMEGSITQVDLKHIFKMVLRPVLHQYETI